MFHHSFEHISNPLETLYFSNKLLSDNGVCLIRIPVVDSWAWENYGVNWVQIDAPRHFFLHSPKSMEILSKKAGFKIKEIVYDSTEFQFWGSEQNKNNISRSSNNSYNLNPSKSIFSKKDIKIFKKKSKKLNLEKRGDQAVFYLIKNDLS
ncbi:MAG TPA: methyltransferase domain-containing protein [Candidatus Pacearchaeota archaeon]|nr:methyltransferase domain-containing protein [Candidatus Pacearchaeota archaeon]